MPLSRQLWLIIGVIVILAMMLWLISALQRLYWQLSYTSPVLAALLVLLLIVLVGVLIFAFLYYNNLFRLGGGPVSRPSIAVPPVKTDAAQANLKALEQQVSQIQDEVARQALLQRSRQISQELERRELRLVVFGTGSAGKTSMINALFGRILGEVGAPMGTTTVGVTYRLQLQGIQRDLLITDTPGVLEAGEGGSLRGQGARQLVVDADLILFVTDNDLRQSEFRLLEALVSLGKRSILVFNKTDRYPEADRQTILQSLQQRVQGLMNPLDVVPIAARPDPVQLESGDPYSPEPDILPLIRRIAIVLRAEGEDLIADNILLQSQRLGEEARKIIDAQRRRQADKVVDQFQWISAGIIAVTPLPIVDLLGTAAVNAQMVVELGRIYGCEINLERGRELALSLAKTLAGLGLIKGSTQLIATSLQVNVATIVVGRAIQGVTAAYLTHIAGRSFIEYFRQNQDWGDGGMTAVVQEQFKLNRRDEFLRSFIQDAVTKVIQPLTDSLDRSAAPRSDTTPLLPVSTTAPFTPVLPDYDRPPVPLPLERPRVQDDWGEN
ncbi:MAG: YcjF family protein, partial [Prochlorothrix sp.]